MEPLASEHNANPCLFHVVLREGGSSDGFPTGQHARRYGFGCLAVQLENLRLRSLCSLTLRMSVEFGATERLSI